mmetsp:Transcript_21504/g.64181  ORF Transcript_21504/g.64181 Transcript_21504/m.64181 type:complete len:201 (+) Transcript_21504:228-830(+)
MAEDGYITRGPRSAGISTASVSAFAMVGSNATSNPLARTTAEVPFPTVATGTGSGAPALAALHAFRKTLAASGEVRTTASSGGAAAPARPASASPRRRASKASKPGPVPCSIRGTSTRSTALASTLLLTKASARAFRSFPFWPASRVRATRSGRATAAREAPRRPAARPAARRGQPWRMRLRPRRRRGAISRPDARGDGR